MLHNRPATVATGLLLSGWVLLMGVIFPVNGVAQQALPSATLGQLEQAVYGQAYPALPEAQRLDRLENTLFYGGQQLNRGWAQSVQMPKVLSGLITPNRADPLPTHVRLDHIQAALAANSPQAKALPPHQPLALLRYLEQRLLNTQYEGQAVDQRLSRLEAIVFGQAIHAKPVPSSISNHGAGVAPDLTPVTLALDHTTQQATNGVTQHPSTPLDTITQRLQRLLYAVPLDPRSVRIHKAD
jgi:hypothetical protein